MRGVLAECSGHELLAHIRLLLAVVPAVSCALGGVLVPLLARSPSLLELLFSKSFDSHVKVAKGAAPDFMRGNARLVLYDTPCIVSVGEDDEDERTAHAPRPTALQPPPRQPPRAGARGAQPPRHAA